MPKTAEEIYRVPNSECPHCRHRLNACSTLDTPRAPRPGDLSVCIGCGEVVQFGARLELQRAPVRVLIRLKPRERAELRKAQSAVRAMLADPPA
jgi:hypothetical protein